jgi:acyl dehydratase
MALNYKKILNWPFEDVVQSYTKKDSIIYALSLGLGLDPTDPAELHFVYEKGLMTFPTMAVVMGHPGPWMKDPATGIDFVRVLHGEQYLQIEKSLPAEGTIIGRTRVVEIIDKGAGKGALIFTERKIYERKSGDLLNTQNATVFARGNGGFGGPAIPAPESHRLPAREPDKTVDLPTSPQAALLYRLNGDYNPLHADPEIAAKAGFEAPILHGLATYGMVARALLKAFDIEDPSRLVSFGLRFSAPVYPGETIRTEIWNDGHVISFRASVVERELIVLNNGRAEIAPDDAVQTRS